jgi:hypothetical protein
MSVDGTRIGDAIAVERGKGSTDEAGMHGVLVAVLTGPDGQIKGRCEVHNLITSAGDAMYAGRGAGVAGAPAAPTGIKLGAGSTAVAKTGAGAALVTYLTGSNKAFDSGFPSLAANVVTYKRTYAAGEATTASPITEAAVVNDTITTDATSAAANTASRVLLSGIGSKGASDVLTLTWTHTLTGA